jgi:hypothetical protein
MYMAVLLHVFIFLLFPFMGTSSFCHDSNSMQDTVVMLQQGLPMFPPHSKSSSSESTHTFTEKHSQGKSNLIASMTKAQVEVVLSQHDEGIEWSDSYAHLRTIYCKGHIEPAGCIRLTNVGREGHTYFWHIVKNYDNLAEWTVFSHAQKPSIGYVGDEGEGGHMMPGYSFYDYVTDNPRRLSRQKNNGADFILTGALDVEKFHHYMRIHYVTPSAKISSNPTTCPSETGDGWESWPFDEFTPWLADKCNTTVAGLPLRFSKYWANLDIEKPRVVFFAQGARFAVSRQKIHQRPKEFYEKMLDFVSKSIDPCENYFNEWMWFYMMGRPESEKPCRWSNAWYLDSGIGSF